MTRGKSQMPMLARLTGREPDLRAVAGRAALRLAEVFGLEAVESAAESERLAPGEHRGLC